MPTKPTILIVDDSTVVRTQMRNLFERSGYQVLEAQTGLDALSLLSERKSVQLVITDVNMPQMDGLSFCQLLRSDPEHKDLPVFVLTTEISQELKNAGKAAGVLLWILKPADHTLLLATVEKTIGAAAGIK